MFTNKLRVASYLSCVLGTGLGGLAQTADARKATQPIATVAGQPVYDEDLTASILGQLLPLRRQEYEVKKKALDTLIEEKLLEAAAKKKSVTTEKLLQQEADAKIQEPTEGELQAYYLAQKDRLNGPFDSVKDQVRQGLRHARIQQARQDYLKELRSSAEVVILLEPPKVKVGYDPARLRGNPKAPVVIVEFSDFQCPYCRQMEPTLKAVSAKYGDRVSLAYRDFPLRSLHPQAEIAAEASRCAGEQGNFWEYHDQLLSGPRLDRPALLQHARTLKLDDKQFDSCLSDGRHRPQVDKDVQDGTQAGVSGTPAFFINGVLLTGAQSLDTLTRIIDEELARKK